jgi:hypothetical protein
MSKDKDFWFRVRDWIYLKAYQNRSYWVDIPWALLLYFTWQHFLTQGDKPLVQEFVFVCWALLTLYWSVKELPIKRKCPQAVQTRWGGIAVAAWLGSYLTFIFMMSRNPQVYQSLPPLMSWTVLIVVGGYIGVRLIPPNPFSKVIESATDKK